MNWGGAYYDNGALLIDVFLESEQSYQIICAGFLQSFGVETLIVFIFGLKEGGKIYLNRYRAERWGGERLFRKQIDGAGAFSENEIDGAETFYEKNIDGAEIFSGKIKSTGQRLFQKK